MPERKGFLTNIESCEGMRWRTLPLFANGRGHLKTTSATKTNFKIFFGGKSCTNKGYNAGLVVKGGDSQQEVVSSNPCTRYILHVVIKIALFD